MDAVDGVHVTACIRERDITLSPEGVGLPGRVLDVKFLGDVARLEVGVEGFDAPLKVRVREIDGWTRGAEGCVGIDPARVLGFPAGIPGSEGFVMS